MSKNLSFRLVLLAISVTGCATSQDDRVQIPLESDPRVGEQVTQVCFTQNLDSWQNVDNDRKALIVKMSNREYYKLKLSGICDADWARTTIAVITRPGSGCFSRGDKVKTDADTAQGYGSGCTIMAINRWNPDAVKQAESEEEAD